MKTFSDYMTEFAIAHEAGHDQAANAALEAALAVADDEQMGLFRQAARECGVFVEPAGYGPDGQPVIRVEDAAQQWGVSVDDVLGRAGEHIQHLSPDQISATPPGAGPNVKGFTRARPGDYLARQAEHIKMVNEGTEDEEAFVSPEIVGLILLERLAKHFAGGDFWSRGDQVWLSLKLKLRDGGLSSLRIDRLRSLAHRWPFDRNEAMRQVASWGRISPENFGRMAVEAMTGQRLEN